MLPFQHPGMRARSRFGTSLSAQRAAVVGVAAAVRRASRRSVCPPTSSALEVARTVPEACQYLHVPRPELPRGTVTFLFTDVVGSTKLLHDFGPERFATLLADHRRALRETFAAYGGIEVDTQGDAFFIAFGTAGGAVTAAGEAVTALSDGPVQVRNGHRPVRRENQPLTLRASH